MRSSLTAVVVFAVICAVQCQQTEEPTLKIMAKSSVFNVNETRGIFCKGKNVQDPVEWYDPAGNKVEERASGNRIYVEWKNESDSIVRPLILSNMVLTDSGNWTCKSGEISETKEIIVGEKCKIADSDVTEEGEEDKSIRFSCKAKGHPPPVFTWAKEVLNDEGKKERATIKATNKKYVIRADHSLEIKKLNHADVGVYFCKATQKALSHFAEKTIHLTVRHKPVLYNPETLTYYTDTYKTEELFTVLNVTKYINCTAIANPPPMYRWFRRTNDYDEPIVDPDVIQTSEDGVSSVLLLRVYNQSDLGEYKCTANNTRGSESIIFHVRMGNKPSVPDSVSFIGSNTTSLTFKVVCPSCIYDVGGPVDPSNLTITGFDIRVVRYKENYEPDWDEAELFEFEATNVNDTIFVVGPVANSTKYYAQARSRNAAGGSDWLDVPPKQGEEFIFTTDAAIKTTATLLLVITAIMSLFLN